LKTKVIYFSREHEEGKAIVEEEEEQSPRFGTVNFERRKYPRISVNLPLRYWKINETRICTGRTVNISEGGVLLYPPEKLQMVKI
jgi:c-di-GMP-binding flagellar brake protein YcgR